MPIDVATGTMILSETDVAIPIAMPLILTRRYSTANIEGVVGPLGPGWSHEWEAKLRQDLDGYRFTSGRGEEIVFDDLDESLATSGTVVAPAAFAALTEDDGELVVTQWGDFGVSRRCGFRGEVMRWMEFGSGQRYLFEYDEAGRLSVVIEERGRRRLVLIYRPQGRLSSVYYEARGERVRVAGYEYDDAGRLVAAVDASETPSIYLYDEAHRIVRERRRNRGEFTFNYDSMGRCVSSAGHDGYDAQELQYLPEAGKTLVTDSRGGTWIYEYGPDGHLSQIISPLGSVRRTMYDALGRVIALEDPLWGKTLISYDERCHRRLVKYPGGGEERFEYDEARRLCQVMTESGAVWRFDYDRNGRVVREEGPHEEVWRYVYNARGDLESVIDPLLQHQTFGCDAQGDLEWMDLPSGGRWTFERDIWGRTIRQTDPTGLTTSLTRDARGFPKQMTLPDGRTWRYAFDVDGNMTMRITPDGLRTSLRYGACRRLLQIDDPSGGVRRFRWSNVPGQLVEFENEAGASHRFEYDLEGRVTREVGFGGRERRFVYGESGREIAEIDEQGSRTTTRLDEAGRVSSQTFPDGQQRRFEYNPQGQLLAAVNGAAEVRFTRDLAGRVVREQVGDDVIERSHDRRGNVVGLRGSFGLSVDFKTLDDGCSQRLSIAPPESEDAAWQIRWERDTAGKLLTQHFPGGVRAYWEWAATGLLARISVEGRREEIQTVDYQWKRSDQLATSTVRGSPQGVIRYTHDERGNLVRAAPDEGTEQVRAVDRVGNLYRYGVGFDRQYGPDGELQYDLGTTRKYGTHGELVEKRSLDGSTWKYRWNGARELAEVERPDGLRVTFTYDALGRRIRKNAGKESVEYVWAGADMVHERGRGGSVSWVYGPDSFTPVARISGGARYGLLSDYLGAPEVMVDEEGRVAWKGRLDLFGAMTVEVEDVPCPWRWPGQYQDEETGLYYNRFRYYDPDAGGYIQPDPLGLRGGGRLYAYVGDPLMAIDPLGLAATWDCGAQRWRDRDSGKFVKKPTNPEDLVYNGRIDFQDIQQWSGQHGLTDVWGSSASFPTGGFKFFLTSGSNTYRVHGHGINPMAVARFPGSNSATGPTASIRNMSTQDNFMTSGNWAPFNTDKDAAHIPLDNSPY